jgi:restriction system protein
MAIPDFQFLMLPFLKLAEDGQIHSSREAVEALAEQFHLTEDEKKELLPSGRQTRFSNRVA